MTPVAEVVQLGDPHPQLVCNAPADMTTVGDGILVLGTTGEGVLLDLVEQVERRRPTVGVTREMDRECRRVEEGGTKAEARVHGNSSLAIPAQCQRM